MVLPALAVGAMAAGTLAQMYSGHKDRQAQAGAVAAENARKNDLVNQVRAGAQAGSAEMQEYYKQLISSQTRNPAYSAYTISDYNDYLGGSSPLASEMYGRGTTNAQALAQAANLNPDRINAYSYDPINARAALANAQTGTATRIGNDMETVRLRDSDLSGLTMQQALRDQMGARARGELPSIAEQQYLGALDQAQERQAGLAAQQRGGLNSVLAQRNVQNMGANAMQDAARQSGVMALEERERAETSYGGLLGQMRQAATARDVQQANFEQAANQANLNKAIEQARMNQSMELSNLDFANQAALTNAASRNQMALANAQAQNTAGQFYAGQQAAANQANVANDLAAQQYRANAYTDALTRAYTNQNAANMYNADAGRQAAYRNTAYTQALRDQQGRELARGAYADVEGAKAGLGVQNQAVAQPSLGNTLIRGLGSMTQAGGNYMMQTQPGTSNPTNQQVTNSINRMQANANNVLGGSGVSGADALTNSYGG